VIRGEWNWIYSPQSFLAPELKSEFMSEPLAMTDIQRKAFFSTLKDGTTEIFQGLLLFIAGILFFNIYTAILGCLLIVFLRLQWPRISQKVKEQYIYPRLGYVELRSDHKAQLKRYHILFDCIIIISILIFFLCVYFNEWSIATTFRYTPIIIGGVLFGKTLYICIFSRKWDYIILGLTSILMIPIFIVFPFAIAQHHTIFYAWTQAILMTVTGIWKYRGFLHEDSINQE
jgi:hypothetical protein